LTSTISMPFRYQLKSAPGALSRSVDMMNSMLKPARPGLVPLPAIVGRLEWA
jgi:hypothetical protein